VPPSLNIAAGETFNIVFVIPANILRTFVFPSNLDDAKMWITIPEQVTRRELKCMCAERNAPHAQAPEPQAPRKEVRKRVRSPAEPAVAEGASGAAANPNAPAVLGNQPV
jgi:hypothetical protein